MWFAAAALLIQAAAGDAAPDKCWREQVENGVRVMVYLGDRSCVPLEPPSEQDGLWINAFEGQRFIPDGTKPADVKRRDAGIWFNMHELLTPDLPVRPLTGHVYRVRFVGRMATDMNRKPLDGYGHMSMSPGLVVVDRMIAMEDLGPLPR